jgi:hypothetical protein
MMFGFMYAVVEHARANSENYPSSDNPLIVDALRPVSLSSPATADLAAYNALKRAASEKCPEWVKDVEAVAEEEQTSHQIAPVIVRSLTPENAPLLLRFLCFIFLFLIFISLFFFVKVSSF